MPPLCRAQGFAAAVLPPPVSPLPPPRPQLAPPFPTVSRDYKDRAQGEALPPSTISAPMPQHRSASTLPPLCAGKPPPMCSQVEFPSCRRPKPQPRSILTPTWSYHGCPTPPPSSPQAATGAIFHRSSPSPDHPSTNIIESRSPSTITPSLTSDVSSAAHRCPPPPEPPSRTALYR
jgi:hypothetical protein